MALGNLQSTIEKLQKMIEAHRGYLAGNETRTRQVLIDPLLQKLGWNVSNPNIVQLEYQVKQGQPDYALMSKGKPVAVVEAKRLESDLGDDQIIQALAYAVAGGIPYIIITNGDTWEMYDVFKPAEFEDCLLIKLELSQQPADKNAAQAWAMRKSNLTSKAPVFKPPKPVPDQSSRQQPNKPPKKQFSDTSFEDSDNWCSFERKLYEQHTKPVELKIGDRPKEIVKSWKGVIHKVVAWLADEERLSVNDCPIGTETYTFIGREAVNPDGTSFQSPQTLSNGLILHGAYVNTIAQWHKLRQLLGDLEVDRSTIRVSFKSTRKAKRSRSKRNTKP